MQWIYRYMSCFLRKDLIIAWFQHIKFRFLTFITENLISVNIDDHWSTSWTYRDQTISRLYVVYFMSCVGFRIKIQLWWGRQISTLSSVFKKMLSVVRQGKVGGFPGSFSFLVVSSPSHLHNDITVSLISEQISPS